MKNLTVIIQPVKFDNLKKRLIDIGIHGMTVTNVEGYGIPKRAIKTAKPEELAVELLPKLKIEMVLKDAELQQAIDAVIDVTRTGRIGDGKLFIYEVSEAMRIRTGERGGRRYLNTITNYE